MFWLLGAIFLSIILSAFFSGSEAAFFSLTSWQRSAHPLVKKLISHPQRLLGTLLIGNLIVNTTATALFTLFLVNIAQNLKIPPSRLLSLGGLVMTIFLLFAGEISPKLFASKRPEKFSHFVALPVNFFQTIFFPFTFLLNKLSRLLTFLPKEPQQLSDEELYTMIEVGKGAGIFPGGEEEILRNLIDFDKRTVSEIMTPRSDIVALSSSATITEALSLCRETGFSRVPLYEGAVDNIVGVVYAKELLTAENPEAKAITIARLPYFVPEVKRLLPLLNELRRKNSHIAIVVDEFGQTAGLVTLEDLLEAILGEIADEFDHAEELPYEKLAEGKFLVDGEIDLATLNRLFNNAFAGVQFERLSAFIHDRLGRLPVAGDRLEFRDMEILIQAMSGHKLKKVLIKTKGNN
ncbi:MAG: hemolysin family protein [candidate division WOR-3 bacterium]